MDKNFVDIINNLFKYLELKRECIEKQYENLYDVITIFINEIFELNDIACIIENVIDKNYKTLLNIDDEKAKEIINTYEENLVNEIADVLLTTARLIHEFNLQEALSEMIEYKYERQKSRELKRFNNE